MSTGCCSNFLFLIFQANDVFLPYPGWALAVLSLLIIFAMLPVPVGFIYSYVKDRREPTSRDTEAGHYNIVNTDETPMTDMSEQEHINGFVGSASLPMDSA